MYMSTVEDKLHDKISKLTEDVERSQAENESLKAKIEWIEKERDEFYESGCELTNRVARAERQNIELKAEVGKLEQRIDDAIAAGQIHPLIYG